MKQLPSLYATAHVFCAPNTGGESQGIVLLEALASGRPVVASDIPGFRSVIRHQRRWIAGSSKDHEQLAWAVCHCWTMNDERARLEAAARERAKEFGWPRVAGQVEEYYRELLRAAPAHLGHPTTVSAAVEPGIAAAWRSGMSQ